jgi:hypothetical protein
MDSVKVTDRTPVSFWTKLNPLWWLVGPDGWTVPTINNGEPYLPEVTNPALRIFYWFFCRNPLMNFVGFVLGVEDRNVTVHGSQDVMATTLRDANPRRTGFNWATAFPEDASLPALAVAAAFAALAYFVWSGFYVAAAFTALKFDGPLPYVGWYGKIGPWMIETYLGWRPASGGFGFKLVKRDD